MAWDEFVKTVTLKVCSSLDIETGMQQALGEIRHIMPAEELLLHFYDPKADAIRTIARATAQSAGLINKAIPLPPGLDLVNEISQLPRTGMTNGPGESRLNDLIMDHYGMAEYSLLQMFLETREQKYGLGHLTLCARGCNRYTKENLTHFVRVREPFTIATINALHHLKILASRKTLAAENQLLKQELSLPAPQFIGEQTGLAKVMEKIRQVAPTDSLVLLAGETGAGKEVAAARIHELSRQRNGPFVKMNCGAVTDSLVDTEFFGHEKGAFSGAVSPRPGKFERAHRGTLFLDEIGELSPTAQVRLLRVLQNGIVERVGGTSSIQTRVRVIAATNRSLEKMVRAGTFRQDLWFRINVFPIDLPPLRERMGDLPLLAHHFIREKALEMNLPIIPELSKPAMAKLMAYHWPGNARELKNILERALILTRGPELDPESISLPQPPSQTLSALTKTNLSKKPPLTAPDLSLDHVMAEHIRAVLAMTRGKIHGPGGAAEIMEINAGTLRHRMNKLRIVYGKKTRPGTA